MKRLMYYIPHFITEEVMFDECDGIAYPAFSASIYNLVNGYPTSEQSGR